MNDPALENEVIRRWQERTPMRRIAAELRISRYLVKRIILDQQNGRAEGRAHPDLPTPPKSRGSILDGQIPFIQDLLTRWPAITALRIHEELCGRGFTGKYTIVKDLVRRLRPEPRRQPVLRFESGKGQQAQMDYATYEIEFAEEGRRRVNLFSYILGYSRRKQDLTIALERAARFGAFSLRSVERILAAQAQPKTPLESLGDQQQQHLREILQDRPVPPRPTADYEQLYLYPQEPPDDEQPPETPDPNQPKP